MIILQSDKGKTIKQIADEPGVSKTAIRNKMTKEVKNKFADVTANQFAVVSTLIEMFQNLLVKRTIR